ncbi:MAG: hypothetical protein K8L97_32680 [Anaerolineae bacterium]|nr:hypothetical protein [Anaerolineae bacterium]
MRKYHWLAVVGVLFLTAGFALLVQTSVVAQDEPTEPLEDPPYLAQYYFAWVESPHADRTAEAFVHWDAEGEVPESCAKCHSEPGYLDFMGEDGSEFGVVDAPAAIGTVVTCDTCHNPTAVSLTTVAFPSGVEITDDGGSARCMQCHQGRASTDTVNAKLVELNLVDDLDTVNPELSFINIHYYAAAASLYGAEARGGYQYDGQVYQMKNEHVPGYATCASCHEPHTLTLKVTECATCHEDVETVEDLRFIRMEGSSVDYDGDGDDNEGIAEEIETLQEMLYQAIQTYAREVSGTPLVYDSHSHPYFFIDTNDNGEADEDEINSDNRYNAFTGNLLSAAYNYQVTLKDPGGYAHNPQYHIQLLFDSIAVLNEQIGDPVDLSTASRNDPGHFNVTTEAFRHWDADGEVPGTCARCHTAEGLPVYLANGVNIAEEPSNSLTCTTCHDSLSEFTLRVDNEVAFPSGSVVSFGEEDENNLCLNCHQGRESTVSVNNAIARAGVGDDEVAEGLTFRNIHYFAAGASLFGTEARGAYEFEGKEYVGRNMHDGEEILACTDCHQPHSGEIRINECEDCHEEVLDPEDVRLIRVVEDITLIDYDGDGNDTEPIADEIDALESALLTALQAYATNTIGTSIAYDSHSHPYWFIDSNGNGTADPEEVNGDNRYATWTPTLLRAAYNYQYVAKDPGAFAHNADYILQVLYDSIEAVGGAEAVASYTRPPM